MNLILFEKDEVEFCEAEEESEEAVVSDVHSAVPRCVVAVVRLRGSDERAVHIANTLGSANGDLLKVGILDGPICGGTVHWVGEAAEDFNAEMLRRRESKLRTSKTERKRRCDLELRLDQCVVDFLHKTESAIIGGHSVAAAKKQSVPEIHVVLAAPRPKVMHRLWPVIAQLGVKRVTVIGAHKTEKHYFDSKHLSDSVAIRKQLIVGLSQSGVDTTLPTVKVMRTFKRFLASMNASSIQPTDSTLTASTVKPPIADSPMAHFIDSSSVFSTHSTDSSDLSHALKSTATDHTSAVSVASKMGALMSESVDDVVLSDSSELRILTHLGAFDSICELFEKRQCTSFLSDAALSGGHSVAPLSRVTVAIGAEGGWVPQEIEALTAHGFELCSLGPRIFKTDTALVSIVAIVSENIRRYYSESSK